MMWISPLVAAMSDVVMVAPPTAVRYGETPSLSKQDSEMTLKRCPCGLTSAVAETGCDVLSMEVREVRLLRLNVGWTPGIM